MPNTTVKELNDQVERAHQAFSITRESSPKEREKWLIAIADALESDAEELVALAVSESHLPEARLRGELKRTAFQLRLLGEETRLGENLDATIDHADPDWGMGARPDIRRVNEPVGPVGVFGGSNFPFAFSVVGGDSASALAAGCTVIHKAHDAQPQLAQRTAELVISALRSAGAPDATFSLVTGFSTGEALVEHPLIRAAAFTGSTAGGRALLDRIAARPQPIPFFGEMGSTNPVFVAPLAWKQRKEEILQGFLGSVALGSGQFCTKPGFLVVPKGTNLGVALSDLQAEVSVGEMLTSRIRDGFVASEEGLRQTEGMRTLLDGGQGAGLTILATDASTVLQEPSILGHEMFGPASVIIEYGDHGEMLAVAHSLEGQLTAGVHAEDDDEVEDLVQVIGGVAGRVLWNEWPTGVSVTYAQQHGGPYPATTSYSTTSVGTSATRRFLRPVAYQGFPDRQLPPSLQEDNPWNLRRRVDGVWVESAPGQDRPGSSVSN